MTSGVSDIGGYDYNFVDAMPDEYQCLICHLVARDPQQLLCCGKLCYNSCLEESKKHTDNCPQCRKRVQSFNDIHCKLNHYIILLISSTKKNYCPAIINHVHR